MKALLAVTIALVLAVGFTTTANGDNNDASLIAETEKQFQSDKEAYGETAAWHLRKKL